MRFYNQAQQRQKKYNPNQLIALDGLKVDYGVLPGSSGAGTIEQSSLVITDPDPRETQAVQIIVPRVSGSFLDPAEPTPEFLKEQAMEVEKAVRTHRYAAVFLLPKPINEQAAASDGDDPAGAARTRNTVTDEQVARLRGPVLLEELEKSWGPSEGQPGPRVTYRSADHAGQFFWVHYSHPKNASKSKTWMVDRIVRADRIEEGGVVVWSSGR